MFEFSEKLFVLCVGISIHASVLVDPVTGLSTTSSTLEYSAQKEDTAAQFTCSTQTSVGAELLSSPVTFTITCESPLVTLSNLHKVLSAQERNTSAENSCLKCWLMMAFCSSVPQLVKKLILCPTFSSPEEGFLYPVGFVVLLLLLSACCFKKNLLTYLNSQVIQKNFSRDARRSDECGYCFLAENIMNMKIDTTPMLVQ